MDGEGQERGDQSTEANEGQAGMAKEKEETESGREEQETTPDDTGSSAQGGSAEGEEGGAPSTQDAETSDDSPDVFNEAGSGDNDGMPHLLFLIYLFLPHSFPVFPH